MKYASACAYNCTLLPGTLTASDSRAYFARFVLDDAGTLYRGPAEPVGVGEGGADDRRAAAAVT